MKYTTVIRVLNKTCCLDKDVEAVGAQDCRRRKNEETQTLARSDRTVTGLCKKSGMRIVRRDENSSGPLPGDGSVKQT